MLATLLLELGLPDAPHSDCGRWKAAFPRAVEEVFGRNGVEFEGVRPMGSLRRLAFLVEGIPTSVGAHQVWVDGPLVRVGRAPDGRFTPVAVKFAERVGKPPSELEIKEREGVQRFGATVSRAAALTATVLPTLLPELLDRLAASDRSNASRGVALGDALQWIVALFGDSRVRFRWAHVQSDRYTYKAADKKERIAVPHFYEYHATLAQAGIRVDEATRKEHIVRQLNAAAADFGGRCVVTERQLAQLSERLDRPVVYLRRGLPLELNSGFVEALASASVSAVPVKRDGGALAPGWLVVSEEGDQQDHELTDTGTRTFERCLTDAADWIARRETSVARREMEGKLLTFVEALPPDLQPLPKERPAFLQALWLCRWAESTLTHACFPGVELHLASQRAVRPKVSPLVSSITDGLCQWLSPTPDTLVRSPSEQRLVQKALIVLALARLTEGFAHHQAPLAERDPLGLRLLADRLFTVLSAAEVSLSMLRASRLAHAAFCGHEGDKDAQMWDDEGALAAFLRHRFRRFVERFEPALAKHIPPSGDWSVFDILKHQSVNPTSTSGSNRRRTRRPG